MQFHELKALDYHISALTAAVAEFVRKSPAFEGDKELASVIGTQVDNIESAIDYAKRDMRSGRT